MIKPIEYEDDQSWFKGHVEYVKRIENGMELYTVSSFIEDKLYGCPWEFVAPENLANILFISEKGVMKELKKMAATEKAKTLEGKMQGRGYSNF